MTSFPSVLDSALDLRDNEVSELFRLANKLQNNEFVLPQRNSLNAPVIATFFLENSTRTKYSFAIAAKKIGAHYIDFQIENSSLKKGESIEETMRTLNAQGVNVLIVRSSINQLLSCYKNHPYINMKLINAGDGVTEHPTQALLDLYTILELQKEKKIKTIGLSGDLIHSRVGHSLLKLLPRFGLTVTLFAPEYFKDPKIKDFKYHQNKNEFLADIDLLYLLRIQFERHTNLDATLIDPNNYHREYGFTYDEISKFDLPVMHPGPCNIGVELDEKLLKSKFYLAHKQVENSVYVRMAILLKMLGENEFLA